MALDLSVVGKPLPPQVFRYEDRDVMLYALAIGGGHEELDYCLELRGPKVYPTFGVIPALWPMLGGATTLKADLVRLLHGEQRLVLHAPIPPKGVLTTESTVSHVYDKGKGALVIVDMATRTANGKLLFENRSSLFVRGAGGFGGESGPKGEDLSPPEGRAPDFRREEKTSLDQALLYRLTGDRNPLHADPDFAAMARFPQPILHGLCSFGFLGRAVLHHAAGGDPKRIKELSVRFSDVVFPGDTLISEGWDMGEGLWRLQVSTARGGPVITNAMTRVA